MDLDRVDGPVHAIADHGGVEARGLAKGAKVRTTGGDVSLDGFSGPVEVEVERGSARLAPRAALAAEVTVTATQGEVRLDVPDGSRFDLDAESRRGELRSGGAGARDLEHGRRAGARLTASRASSDGGGVAVHLRADGDVTLEAKPAGRDRRPPGGEARRSGGRVAAGGGAREDADSKAGPATAEAPPPSPPRKPAPSDKP